MTPFLGGTIDGVPSNAIVWNSIGWAMWLIRQHVRDSAFAHLAFGVKLQSEHPCRSLGSKMASSMIETRSSCGSRNINAGPVTGELWGEGLLEEQRLGSACKGLRSMIARSFFGDGPRRVCRIARSPFCIFYEAWVCIERLIVVECSGPISQRSFAVIGVGH